MNFIEHKAKEIIGFYHDRKHKFRCQALPGKRRLNHVFNSMGLGYADRNGPSTSFLVDDVTIHSRNHGTGERIGHARKKMVGRMSYTAAMESRKKKNSRRGQGFVEPTDVRFGREIVGKVGNSKMVVFRQTCHFGQVWTEMVEPLPTPFFFVFTFISLCVCVLFAFLFSSIECSRLFTSCCIRSCRLPATLAKWPTNRGSSM